jgi:hypothetical protein
LIVGKPTRGQNSGADQGIFCEGNPVMQTRVTSFVAAALVAAFALAPQAMANPAIAQKEGKACNACHTSPPALNAAGQKYKAGMKK